MYSATHCRDVINVVTHPVHRRESCLVFLRLFDARGRKRKMVVDSGASTNFISQSVLPNLDHHIVNENRSKIRLADNKTEETLGTASVSIQLSDGRRKRFEFLILPKTVYDGIIGLSFLQDYDMLLSRGFLLHMTTGETIPIKVERLSQREEQEWANFSRVYIPHRQKITLEPESDLSGGYERKIVDPIGASLVDPGEAVEEHTERGFCVQVKPNFAFSITEPDLMADPKPSGEIKCNINPDLSNKERQQYTELLNEFKSVFVFKAEDLGLYSGPETYRIRVTTDRAQRGAYIPIPAHLRQDFKKHIDSLLEQKLIEPTDSTKYSHSFLAVRKKDGSTRWCSDMRALNMVTEDDSFELPRIPEILRNLSGKQVYTSLDMISAFNQFEIEEQDRDYFAFTCPISNKRYRWRRCFFGLKNIPQYISYIMSNRVFLDKDLSEMSCYIDDITLANSDHKSMLENLRDVLTRLNFFNLKLKLSKCSFGYSKISQFGYQISSEGYTIDPMRKAALSNIEPPKTKKMLHTSLGGLGYFRSTLPDFARYSSVLTPLLAKDTPELEWTEEADRAWHGLIKHAQEPLTISEPDFNHPFIVTTDASSNYFGGTLTQEIGNLRKCIAVHSGHFPKNRIPWAIHFKELAALTDIIEKWEHELIAAKFLVRCDNMWVVRMIQARKDLVYKKTGPALRCIMRLSRFNFTIEHKKGDANCFKIADTLSRLNKPWILNHNMTSEIPLLGNEVEESAFMMSENLFPRTSETRVTGPTSENPEIIDTCTDLACAVDYGLPVTYSRAQIRDYVFSEQMLYAEEICETYKDRKGFDSDELTFRKALIVPKQLVKEVLRMLHRHNGMHREYAALKSCELYWDGMSSDIREYVLACEDCSSLRKTPSNSKFVIEPRLPQKPWESIAIDINQAGQGPDSVFVLGLIDHFSKFVLLRKVPSTSIYDCLDVLTQWILQYNISECQLKADNAFNRQDFIEMMNLLNIRCRFSVPANSTSNAEIERAFRVVNEKFRLFQLADRDLNVSLAFIQAEINSTPDPDTQVCPFELIYGHTPNQSLIEPLPISVEKNLLAYAKSKYDRLRRLSSFIAMHYDRKAENREVTRIDKLHKIGDKVRILMQRKPGINKWSAVPYSKTVYTIKDVRKPTRSYELEYKLEGRQPIRILAHHRRVKLIVQLDRIRSNLDSKSEKSPENTVDAPFSDQESENSDISPEISGNDQNRLDPLGHTTVEPADSARNQNVQTTRVGRKINLPLRYQQ